MVGFCNSISDGSIESWFCCRSTRSACGAHVQRIVVLGVRPRPWSRTGRLPRLPTVAGRSVPAAAAPPPAPPPGVRVAASAFRIPSERRRGRRGGARRESVRSSRTRLARRILRAVPVSPLSLFRKEAPSTKTKRAHTHKMLNGTPRRFGRGGSASLSSSVRHSSTPRNDLATAIAATTTASASTKLN